MEPTKICSKCGRELPATTEYFHKSKLIKSGLRPQCKECVKQDYQQNKEEVIKRVKRYYRQNKEDRLEWHKQRYQSEREEILEHKKQYQKQHPEIRQQYKERNKERIAERDKRYREQNKERIAARSKQHYELNKERLREQRRKYSRANRGKCTETSRIWRSKNRDKVICVKQNREARKRCLPATLTVIEWEEAKQHFDNKCAYCGEEIALTQDHFVPLIKGGAYVRENIVPACRHCNSSKNGSDFFKWYPKQPYYSKDREQAILNYLQEVSHDNLQPAANTNSQSQVSYL